MKILLLKDIPGVGQKNDIKEVAEGFARNFLFPKKLAIRATDMSVHAVERRKTARE